MQKRPIILSILLTKATPYEQTMSRMTHHVNHKIESCQRYVTHIYVLVPTRHPHHTTISVDILYIFVCMYIYITSQFARIFYTCIYIYIMYMHIHIYVYDIYAHILYTYMYIVSAKTAAAERTRESDLHFQMILFQQIM